MQRLDGLLKDQSLQYFRIPHLRPLHIHDSLSLYVLLNILLSSHLPEDSVLSSASIAIFAIVNLSAIERFLIPSPVNSIDL